MLQKRELSESEIRQALLLPDPNDRKTFTQTLAINFFAQVGCMLLSAHTRWGKLFCLRALLLRYRKTKDDWVNIVLPTNPIKDEFEAFLGHIPKIRFFLIASYCSEDLPLETYTCGLFIGDECQNFLNPEAKRNSQVLPLTNSPLKLVLSATVTPEMKAYLESQGIKHEFHIPLKTGVRLGIVPGYQNLNLPVQLTPDEKELYRKLDQKVQQHLRTFQLVSPEKAEGLAFICADFKSERGKSAVTRTANYLGYSDWSVVGEAINYRTAVGKRADLLYQAGNKEVVTLELLQALPPGKKLLFGSRLVIGDRLAKQIPGLQVYRTGSTKAAKEATKEILRKFYTEEAPYLYGCNTLNEGFTVTDCDTAINLGVKSKQLTDIQRTGRLLSLDPNNPDKLATKINLFVDDFTLPGLNPGDPPQQILSQERKWLTNSQRGQLFTTWLTDLNDLKNYIELNPINEEIPQ